MDLHETKSHIYVYFCWVGNDLFLSLLISFGADSRSTIEGQVSRVMFCFTASGSQVMRYGGSTASESSRNSH